MRLKWQKHSNSSRFPPSEHVESWQIFYLSIPILLTLCLLQHISNKQSHHPFTVINTAISMILPLAPVLYFSCSVSNTTHLHLYYSSSIYCSSTAVLHINQNHRPGTLNIFQGRRSLHSVTECRGSKNRFCTRFWWYDITFKKMRQEIVFYWFSRNQTVQLSSFYFLQIYFLENRLLGVLHYSGSEGVRIFLIAWFSIRPFF